MRLRQIYESIIQIGIHGDPRGDEGIRKALEAARKEYEGLKERERARFDLDRLHNPYADTRILHGDPETDIRSVLTGIDIEIGEILLAERLKEKGIPVDAIIAHHPEGGALAAFYRVMTLQTDLLHQLGVSVTVAEALLEERMKEVSQKIMPINHNRSVMAARLLDIPFLCCHTPADNAVYSYLRNLFEEKGPYWMGDIIDILLDIPEYQEQAAINAGPQILVGSPTRRCGKIFVDMTGGTEGSKEIYQRLAQEGLGTIVAMHMSEEHKKEAEAHHLNVVIAGHIGSDSLGMNLVFDRMRAQGNIDIVPCSGYVYHSRG
jgi:putative NIF3 family GTP cyclohydrolase 1 type 2